MICASKAGPKKFKALNKKCNNENFADGSKSRKIKKKNDMNMSPKFQLAQLYETK